jgi:hypothetical protein
MKARLIAIAVPFLVGALAWQDPEKPKAPSLPEVGKPAPAFRLNDHHGKAVEVGGKADRWTVIAFYPKAATPG